MKIEVEIEQAVFEAPVKEAVANAVRRVVDSRVDALLGGYRIEIEKAVDVYLAKRLTDTTIKNSIDQAVAQLIQDRLARLE